VHTDVLLRAGDGHSVTVDHVHWAVHADAVVAPRHGAAKAATRLLRRCCERLVVDHWTLVDAEAVLGDVVATAVRSTAQAARVELDIDQDVIRLRVTVATVEPAVIGALISAVHLDTAEVDGDLAIRTTDTSAELTVEMRLRPPLAG
jgi:hypothetical protein